MTDGTFQAARNAVSAENDPNQKCTSTREIFALVAIGSKMLRPHE